MDDPKVPKVHPRRVLIVNRSSQVGRLEKPWLAEAYEQVLPIRQCRINPPSGQDCQHHVPNRHAENHKGSPQAPAGPLPGVVDRVERLRKGA